MSVTKNYLAGVMRVNVEEYSFEGKAVEEFKKIIEENITFGEKNILINLPQVVFMDSYALTELFAAFNQLNTSGGALKLVCPKASAKKILELTKLSKTIEVYDDEETALLSFNGKRGF